MFLSTLRSWICMFSCLKFHIIIVHLNYFDSKYINIILFVCLIAYSWLTKYSYFSNKKCYVSMKLSKQAKVLLFFFLFFFWDVRSWSKTFKTFWGKLLKCSFYLNSVGLLFCYHVVVKQLLTMKDGVSYIIARVGPATWF